MKTVNISVALEKSSPTKIQIGRQGENRATKVIFDCSVYAESFGPGTAYLFHQRAPDTCPYPVAIEQDGNTITWEVSASDTEFAGQGQCELFWYVDDVIAKTQVWGTTVTEALTGTESEEVPEAAQGWVSKVLQAIADIGKVNDEVVKAAVAEYIAENGLPDTRGVGFTSWSYDTDTGYIHLYNEDGEEAIEPLYAPGLGFADLTEDELQQVNTILTRASNYAAQAGQAKEAASASAENATKSAQDAATSAERATQSASAAATSETNASQSASSAAADADLAKQYNDSALKAAGEAAQSLSGAQDAAETAQEAAQEAIAARDGFKVDTTLSQSGQAADAKAVGDALSSLSEEKVNQSALGLVIGTDGKIYVAINGVAVGSGIEITGGTASGDEAVDTTYQITLSDGITLNTLMFQDEFDGDGLSSTWKPAYGHDNAALTNWWTADSKNLGVENSCLRLTMLRDNPTSAYEISAAKVETTQYGADNNYNFDTGYCEVKFKLDRVGEGIWPAIWTVGQSMSESFSNITDSSVIRKTYGRLWPWAGEIDQMDAMKSRFGPGGNYQTDDYDSSAKGLSGEGIENKTLEADIWYMIGLYKSKDKIKVYFDRVLIGTFDIADNECFSGMGENLIINISTGTVGGTLPEEINEVNMYVDYVRVYSLSNSMTTLAEQNTEGLLPDCANGFACVAGRSWLLRPEFALNTQNTALYWESDNTAIAKVENGYVTTVANGVCNIIAKDVDGNIVINFALTVKENAGIVATGIKVTSSVEGIAANSSAEITANIYPTNCDSLTPSVTIISGADYCTIDGTTISNNNTSGEDQEIVVRVGTNNPSVYEDITITLLSDVDYSVTPDTHLLSNYNVDGMSDGVKWADSLGFGNTLSYTNSEHVAFTGYSIKATNALWNLSASKNLPMTTDIPEAYTIMLMANMSGTGSPVAGADNIFMSTATNMRLQASAKYNLTVPEYQGVDCVFAITWENGIANAYTMVGDPETIYSITEKPSKAATSADISGLYVIAANNSNGFVGSVYQALLFDTALDVDSIKNYAAQMFAKN